MIEVTYNAIGTKSEIQKEYILINIYGDNKYYIESNYKDYFKTNIPNLSLEKFKEYIEDPTFKKGYELFIKHYLYEEFKNCNIVLVKIDFTDIVVDDRAINVYPRVIKFDIETEKL